MKIKLSKHDYRIIYDSLIISANSYLPTIDNLRESGNAEYAKELEFSCKEVLKIANKIARGIQKKKKVKKK